MSRYFEYGILPESPLAVLSNMLSTVYAPLLAKEEYYHDTSGVSASERREQEQAIVTDTIRTEFLSSISFTFRPIFKKPQIFAVSPMKWS